MCRCLILFAVISVCVNLQCPEARENPVDEAIKQLKNNDPDIRTRAFRKLQEAAAIDKANVPALMELLKERDWDIRGNAAAVLGKIGPAALPILCEALADRTPEVRAGAAYALGFMGGKARPCVPKLIHALDKDVDQQVRGVALDALARIGGREAINVLIKTLKEDLDKSIRLRAAWALGQKEYAAQVVSPLLETLAMKQTDIDDQAIVRGAVSSLSILGFPAVRPLLDAIKNPNFAGREHATRALAGVFRELKQYQRLTGEAMQGDIKVALPVLIESARRGSKGIRLATMEALEEMGEKGKGALPVVMSCLKDSSPLVRIMAARSLYHIGGDFKLSLKVFIEAMSNADLDVRRQAIAEIEQLGSRSAPAVPQLIQALGDPDTRSDAINALGQIGPGAKAALPALRELLQDPECSAEAADALERIGHSK